LCGVGTALNTETQQCEISCASGRRSLALEVLSESEVTNAATVLLNADVEQIEAQLTADRALQLMQRLAQHPGLRSSSSHFAQQRSDQIFRPPAPA
jgi:hypothetical protein